MYELCILSILSKMVSPNFLKSMEWSIEHRYHWIFQTAHLKTRKNTRRNKHWSIFDKFNLCMIHCEYKQCTTQHRWPLLILHYPRNIIIYNFPLIGVIYMVIMHVLLSKITQICSQIISLNPKFGSFTRLYWILENLYTKSLSRNITRSYERKQQCYPILVSCFR